MLAGVLGRARRCRAVTARLDSVSPYQSTGNEGLPPRARFLARDGLLSTALFGPDRSPEDPFREIAHRRSLEFAGRAPSSLLASIPSVTKQARYGLTAAKKMDLETVRLFLGARLRIDAPDILF
jgi:hypothetical protein